MAKSLDKMSRQELLTLRSDVDKALRKAESRDRKEAKKAAEEAAAKFGFSLSDVADVRGAARKSKSAGVAGAPKFVNPKDPSQTWTGKGRQPRWYKDAVAKGVDPSKMAI